MDLYFDEIEIGDEYLSQGRTITEADIVNFCGVSGVFHPIHTDSEYAKKSGFSRRIAHGPLIFAVSFGLFERIGVFDETILAFLEFSWKFKKPVFVGDTIRIKDKVIEKRETKRKDRGVVTFFREVFNQNLEVVQEGFWKALLKRRIYGEDN